MAVLNSRALQEQLSAIMAALTKAAVVEICELVDEGYSLLQAEITRSRKENQDLRKKMHLIESIVARGGGGGGGGGALVEPEVTEQGAPAPEAGGEGGAMEEEVNRAGEVSCFSWDNNSNIRNKRRENKNIEPSKL